MVILDRDSRRITTALGRMGVLGTGQGAVGIRRLRRAAEPQPRTGPRAAAGQPARGPEKLGLGALSASPESAYDPLDAVEQEIVRIEGRV